MGTFRHACLLRTFAKLAAVASVLAVLVALLAPGPATGSAPRIVALAAPGQVHPGERVALYLGVADVPAGARAVVRVCNTEGCPVDRVQPLRSGPSDWTWLANAVLGTGDYRGVVYLQRLTPFGHRTVDLAEWTVRVRP